ncbi:hypothetical protein HYC85_025830 [Camellia sinensis]|uniref:MOB kinase activator-like 1A n=1 Tax=Camellia sinensis TaxID=4442 RepID=A0A7J7G3W1_CAMSI|nr:hypothetical protein HYC85_025830 [Camellia sinensis]
MSLFGLGSRNQKTFRPKKSAPSGSKAAQLQNHIDATLGSGNLREAVRLPPGEHPNEWLAVNTVDFFNQVNILYEYRWADGVTIKKPIEVSAPKYVEYLMDWIEAQLDDESIFPQKLVVVVIFTFSFLFFFKIYFVLGKRISPELPFGLVCIKSFEF